MRHFAILRRVRVSAWELCNFKKIPKGAARRLRRFARIALVTAEPNLHAHVGNSGTPPQLSWENLHKGPTGRIWGVYQKDFIHYTPQP